MVPWKGGLIPGAMIRPKVFNPDIMRIASVASQGTPPEIFAEYRKRLCDCMPAEEIVWTDHQPDAILFITGGSEQAAIGMLPGQNPVQLFAFPERNAFASAIEVKSYLGRMNIQAELINPDDLNQPRQSQRFRIGIVGTESEWLVNSIPDPEKLLDRLGMHLVRVSWESLPHYDEWPVSERFEKHFSSRQWPQLREHGQVNGLIREIIRDQQLDGIAIECFPMVKKYGITACPALAMLNYEGFPAACEGDLVSLAGLLLVKNSTGRIPWMCNLAGLSPTSVNFSHCTVPFDLVTEYEFDTHYETGQGLAIRGTFPDGEYTILRLDRDFTRAFLSVGKMIPSERIAEACRTQLTLALPYDRVQTLLTHPLGNHHLVLPGNHEDQLTTHLITKGFTII